MIATFLRAHWPALLIAGLAALALAWVSSTRYDAGYAAGVAEWKSKYDDQARQSAENLAAAERANRAKEQAWQASIDGVRRDAQSQVAAARADARDADAANDRLLQQARRLAASASSGTCNTGATGGSAAARDAGVLANMFESSAAEARRYAAAADTYRIAATSCASAYNALRR